MEAQRYPDDFDGIVAGAPAYDFTGIAAQFIKDIQAAFPDKESLSKPLFPAETLKSVEAQIVAKCDAHRRRHRRVDGGSAPLHHRRLVADRPDRSAEEGAGDDLRREETAGRRVIYPAQPVGGEGDAAGGWPMWIDGVNPMLMLALKMPSLRFGFGTEFFKILHLQRSGVGLPEVRLRELSP